MSDFCPTAKNGEINLDELNEKSEERLLRYHIIDILTYLIEILLCVLLYSGIIPRFELLFGLLNRSRSILSNRPYPVGHR